MTLIIFANLKNICSTFHIIPIEIILMVLLSKSYAIIALEPAKNLYHKMFDGAPEGYNAKQKRADRRIENYYEKIRSGRQEKLFHEIVVQMGGREDTGAKDDQGRLAISQIL